MFFFSCFMSFKKDRKYIVVNISIIVVLLQLIEVAWDLS